MNRKKAGLLIVIISLCITCNPENDEIDDKLLGDYPRNIVGEQIITPSESETKLSDSDIFTKRCPGDLYSVNGKIYLLGGDVWSLNKKKISSLYDVWESVDGIKWKNIANDIVLPERGGGYAAIYFKDQFFIFGGNRGTVNDIWVSTDAKRWKRIMKHAAFDPYARSILEIDGKLIMYYRDMIFRIKGIDLWYSNDGIQWRPEAAKLPGYFQTITKFPKINGKAIAIIDNEETYSSFDGISWERIEIKKPFYNRQGFAIVTRGNEMFLMGGEAAATEFFGGICNDVWKSVDGGSTWELISKSRSPTMQDIRYAETTRHDRDDFDTFAPRYAAGAIVHNGKIYLIGGVTEITPRPEDVYIYMNDVWESEDGVTWKHIAGTPVSTQNEYGDWSEPKEE